MEKKILSVSIAAYNVEKTLQETLDPFITSTVLNHLDIMIINDGSTDHTTQIAQKYVDSFPDSFRLINKSNGGWGSTVNTGIAQALGKYFKQLDGDDHFNVENLPAYLSLLEASSADLIISPYVEYDEQTGKILADKDCNPGWISGQLYSLAELDGFSPFMHSLAVRTDCLRNRVHITEHCFYTDTEFVLKSCNQVNTVEFFDHPVYCYRRASTGQSMSLAGLERHYQDQTKVITELLDYRDSSVTRPEVRRIFDKLLGGTCFWQYLVLLYIRPTRAHKRHLMAYDAMLKHRAPDYYEAVTLDYLKRLRKLHFWGYSYYAHKQKKLDNRFSDDGRMLY